MTKTEFKNKYREWYHDYAEKKMNKQKRINQSEIDYISLDLKDTNIALTDLMDLISDFLYNKE